MTSICACAVDEYAVIAMFVSIIRLSYSSEYKHQAPSVVPALISVVGVVAMTLRHFLASVIVLPSSVAG